MPTTASTTATAVTTTAGKTSPSQARQEKALATAETLEPALATLDCDGRIRADAQQWSAISTIVTDYFAALGAAAGPDSKPEYGFSQLTAALGEASFLKNEAQQRAAAASANDLAAGVFSLRRRSLIADNAIAADTALTFFTTRLTGAAQRYKSLLGIERDEITSFFTRNFVTENVGLQTLEALRYREDWKRERDTLDLRVQAADAYIASLEHLQRGNAAIAKAAARKDFPAVEAAASATTMQLKSDIVTLQKAYKEK